MQPWRPFAARVLALIIVARQGARVESNAGRAVAFPPRVAVCKIIHPWRAIPNREVRTHTANDRRDALSHEHS
jgi:hypothetical protein